MDDYIEREPLLKAFKEKCCQDCPGGYSHQQCHSWCDAASEIELIENAPAIDPESLPPNWNKTAENQPTEQDGDAIGSVLTVGYHGNIRNGIWLVNRMTWSIVTDNPEKYPLWMPLPKLPDLPMPEKRYRIDY